MAHYLITLLSVLLLSIPAKAQISEPPQPVVDATTEPAPLETAPSPAVEPPPPSVVVPTPPPVMEPMPPPAVEAKPVLKKPHRLNVGYTLSVLSFPFPMRRGPHASFAVTPEFHVGAQYMKDQLNMRLAGVTFAGAEEKFWTVQALWFFTERFHASFGLGRRAIRLNLLSKHVASALNESGSTHIDVQNLVADIGFSHRWVWPRGVTLQADWLTMTVPISRSRVEGAPLDAIVDARLHNGTEKAISILGRTPGVALLGVSAGWTF